MRVAFDAGRPPAPAASRATRGRCSPPCTTRPPPRRRAHRDAPPARRRPLPLALDRRRAAAPARPDGRHPARPDPAQAPRRVPALRAALPHALPRRRARDARDRPHRRRRRGRRGAAQRRAGARPRRPRGGRRRVLAARTPRSPPSARATACPTTTWSGSAACAIPTRASASRRWPRPRSELPLVLVGDAGAVGARAAGRDVTGAVDDDELAAIYTGARALVFPSDDEGFGLPPVEALACGTPVVACDVPALREVLGDRATFVAVRRPRELGRRGAAAPAPGAGPAAVDVGRRRARDLGRLRASARSATAA